VEEKILYNFICTRALIYSHLVKSAKNRTADMMEKFIQISKKKAQATKE
jgi:hypothetical protein